MGQTTTDPSMPEGLDIMSSIALFKDDLLSNRDPESDYSTGSGGDSGVNAQGEREQRVLSEASITVVRAESTCSSEDEEEVSQDDVSSYFDPGMELPELSTSDEHRDIRLQVLLPVPRVCALVS